jgi:hypothetical protein
VSERREGWSDPRPSYIPPPTAWPAAMALGITFLAWGLITSPVVLTLGVGLFVVALYGWVGEIRHDRREDGN